MPYEFEEVGRLPSPDDNVAIAIRTLEAGTEISHSDNPLKLKHTVLEGHRFAVQPIQKGEALLSWSQPFGMAITDIEPGDYVCNEGVLQELRRRTLEFSLPPTPNFTDEVPLFTFDENRFQPAPGRAQSGEIMTFLGYRRPGSRGVGTRNTIVLLGTTSLTAGFVRALEAHLKPLTATYPNIDAVVAVAHTEGGHERPNNADLLLRTLAGFMVHPNVGAVLAVDYGSEAINNALLRDYMEQHNYPLSDVLHRFLTLSGTFQDSLETAAGVAHEWLDTINGMTRTAVPLSELKIALQCGGSDAFSGISGNPLAAWVAKEVLQHGGSANLAETDELIGAEPYVLQKVRDVGTARKFLSTVQRFKEWAGWHGQSAEGNPSGGNLYRGLYNIYLKSLGAAAKRHPDVRLDHVIDYSEPMREAGFYFMDSPGNDLESIAGQVASGCNLIYFVTGNGSITNFPFVPTIKVVTTSDRYRLLSNEMDVNAGAYLDGTPLDVLGKATLHLTIDVASGQRTVGERAGHAQVQIWRDWRLTSAVDLKEFRPVKFSGKPLPTKTDIDVPHVEIPMFRTRNGYAADQVGLVLPTSLCSGQIARMCVNQLNEKAPGFEKGLSRFVTLVHTEGCGASSVTELTDTLLSYLTHPMVKHALLLEHGCEKTHNSYIRHSMLERGLNPEQFGWASVQLDGGIHNVVRKMAQWFAKQLETDQAPEFVSVGLEAVRLGLITHGGITDIVAHQLAILTRVIVTAGGSVVLPEHDDLLRSSIYLDTLGFHAQPEPTLGYAQPITEAGLHVMAAPSHQWSEVLTGLGATGVECILTHANSRPMPGHPLVPVLQVSSTDDVIEHYATDIDRALTGDATDWNKQLLNLIVETLSRRYEPRLSTYGNVDFQITRGLLGVSL